MAKDDEWSGLLKIPAEVVIRELRIKLGQQAAYIAELEDKLKEAETKEVNKCKLEHLEKEVNRLLNKLNDTQDRLTVIGKRNHILELELLKFLKHKE